MSNKYKLYSKLLQKEDNTKKLKKQKQKLQIQEEERRKHLPIPKFIPRKEQFEYTCHICNDYIVFDTLYLDDFTGKYISLEPDTMKQHKCDWKHVKRKTIPRS
jgi:hypothetical protein